MQQGGVSGQARLNLGAAVVLIEPGMQAHQVVEHLFTQVGHHPLADPGHQIKPREGANGQRKHQRHEQADAFVEQRRGAGQKALIDHQANALPHGQGDRGGDDQRQQRSKGLFVVRRDHPQRQTKGMALTPGKH